MTLDFGSYGLDYTDKLCAAIERYTASEVRLNSEAYVYRGMQLRYAVERLLYIRCINSKPLFQHYLASATSARTERMPSLNPVESDSAFFMCHQRSHTDYPPRRITHWLLRTLLHIYVLLRRQFLSPVSKTTFPCRYNILINIHNIKFAQYLDPIARELDPGSYSYLVSSDESLTDKLLNRGSPVIGYSAESHLSFRNIIFPSYALHHFFGLLDNTEAMLNVLTLLKPQCSVVVEGNSPTDIIMSEASRSLGIPCFCIQQGWSPYVHSGFRNMSFTEMFVCGNRFADLLQPFNPEQTFRVTGSHVFKPKTSINMDNHINAISFFLQSPCALLGVKAFEEFLDLISDVAKSHPNVQVIVREHPAFPLPSSSIRMLENFSNIRLSIPSSEALPEVILSSDLVVSIFSTVLLEAIAVNVVPLICSIGAIREYDPTLVDSGAAIEVNSISEARLKISQLISSPELLASIRLRMSKLSAEYFAAKDSAKIIASLLSYQAP